MKWEEVNTVRDFRTFRSGDFVMTVFHSLHDDLYNVVVEVECAVAIHRTLDALRIKRLYGIEL